MGIFLVEDRRCFDELLSKINVPCLPNNSSQPASIIFKNKWEEFRGIEINPWEDVGCKNHIELLK